MNEIFLTHTPPGWKSLVMECCTLIDAFNDKWGENSVEITSVKQKFGSLRVYYRHNTSRPEKEFSNDVLKLFNDVEERCSISELLCKDCGKVKHDTTCLTCEVT